MNDFERLVQADMRLAILWTLSQDSDYSHNEYVLREVLRTLAHAVSQDKLRTELCWLQEQGLIITTDAAGTTVAKLTARGKDVAEGAVIVPGVKRPEPKF